jgi:ubiquitin carboxyl-terminal hydrolase 7
MLLHFLASDFCRMLIPLLLFYSMLKFTLVTLQVQNFGEPFFLVVHQTETLAEVKLRIQTKLAIPDEEFSKWKFAFLSLGRPEYLQDDDVVASRFLKRDSYGAWEHYLGLEHTDCTPKRSHTSNQVLFPLSFSWINGKVKSLMCRIFN